MKKERFFQTITGRRLALSELDAEERRFLAAVQRKYKKKPKWSEFGSWWFEQFRRSRLALDSVVYRVCQDLEARLGIAERRVAPPDYRDYLADLIEERYGSRYRFCKENGVDPGQLSRVLAGRSELSLKTLQRVLANFGASLTIQSEESLIERIRPENALSALGAAVR